MQDFAAALGSLQDLSPQALLSNEDCLLDTYISLCELEIRRHSYRSLDFSQVEQLERWKLEKNTWMLIKQIFNIRAGTSPLPEIIDGTDRSIVSSYLSTDSQAAEFNAIREWLESIAPPQEMLEVRKAYRPYTLRELESSLNEPSGHLVHELDPDACIRTGKKLHSKDEEYLGSFLKCLFGFIRRGQMSKAIQLCKNSGEHWRAATLLGGTYYNDYNIESARAETQPPIGNKNRGHWMFVCFTLANDSNLNIYERAVYAALCGNTANVLPVCETWEDVMWAFFSSLVISNSEKFLRKFPRIRGSEYREFIAPEAENCTVEDAIAVISRVPNEKIRSENQNVFRQVQVSLMSNQIGDFIKNLAKKIKKYNLGNLSANSSGEIVDPDFLRFIVHLIILIRTLGQTSNEEAENEIILCFTNGLINQDCGELILYYAARSSYDLQIKMMSNLLQSAELDDKGRSSVLKKAYHLGMDVKTITEKTVRNLMDQYHSPEFACEPSLQLDLPLEEAETILVSSIEWLLLEQEQYLEALLQCNQLYRRFLLSGRLNAVVALRKKVESSSANYGKKQFADYIRRLEKFENMIREMTFYSTFVDAIEHFNKWKTMISNKPKSTQKSRAFSSLETDLTRWKADVKSATVATEDAIRKVVAFHERLNWLEDQEMFETEMPEYFDQDQRKKEMEICRSVYVPWLISLLFDVLYDSRDLLPGNVSKALDLANFVASDDRQVWKLFESDPDLPETDPRSKPRMPGFLKKISSSYLALKSQKKQ